MAHTHESKLSESGSVSHLTGVDWIAGLKIRVTTVMDEAHEGTIYSYDISTNTLVLASKRGAAGLALDYRLLKVSFIRDITVLATSDKEETQLTPSPISITAVQARERNALALISQDISRKNLGLAPEAYELFDALKRT